MMWVMKRVGDGEVGAELGDAGFDALYRQCAPAVVAYLLRRTGADDAREVAAEVFLVAWRRRDDLPVSLLPWLLATARRQLANRRRGERRRLALVDRVASAVAVSRSGGDPADGVVTDAVVGEALARLSEDDQEVLRLIAWDDLDPASAAAVLGCSTGALRVRLHRARQRLRAQLHSAGYPSPQPERQQ